MSKVSARIDAWRQQRAQIADDLKTVIAEAQGMLKEIGHDVGERLAAIGVVVGRRGGGRPKGYRASAETRAKLREAWARRKAALGQGAPEAAPATATRRGRKRRTMSTEARARIAAAQRKRWAQRKKSQQA